MKPYTWVQRFLTVVTLLALLLPLSPTLSLSSQDDGASSDRLKVDSKTAVVRRATANSDTVYVDLRILEAMGLEEGAALERVTVEDAARNLGSDVFRLLAASFLARDSGAADDRLALVEHELEQLFTRPLSPVLPPDL